MISSIKTIPNDKDNIKVITSGTELFYSRFPKLYKSKNGISFYFMQGCNEVKRYSASQIHKVKLDELHASSVIELTFYPDSFHKAFYEEIEDYYIKNKKYHGNMLVDCVGRAYMIDNQLNMDSIIKEDLYYICQSNYPYKLYNYEGEKIFGYELINKVNEIPFISEEVKDENYVAMDYITVANGLYYIDNLYINGTLKSSYDKKLDKIDLSFIDDSMVGCKVYIIENGTIKNAIITAPYTKDGRGFGIEYED